MSKQTWKMIRSEHYNHPILIPADDGAIEFLQSIKEDQLIVANLKGSRNPGHHRKFFKLLGFVVDQSDKYISVEQLLVSLKIATGRVDTIIGHDGKTYFLPQSIAFESMDQAAFKRFFDLSIQLICDRFVPTLNSDELRDEFWQFFKRGAP